MVAELKIRAKALGEALGIGALCTLAGLTPMHCWLMNLFAHFCGWSFLTFALRIEFYIVTVHCAGGTDIDCWIGRGMVWKTMG